ncbi:MAG: hypothetical protein FWE85_05630, partial [Clostridiales bacterium]|nr:hypothetical protein [Clostridiales bacterium]
MNKSDADDILATQSGEAVEDTADAAEPAGAEQEEADLMDLIDSIEDLGREIPEDSELPEDLPVSGEESSAEEQPAPEDQPGELDVDTEKKGLRGILARLLSMRFAPVKRKGGVKKETEPAKKSETESIAEAEAEQKKQKEINPQRKGKAEKGQAAAQEPPDSDNSDGSLIDPDQEGEGKAPAPPAKPALMRRPKKKVTQQGTPGQQDASGKKVRMRIAKPGESKSAGSKGKKTVVIASAAAFAVGVAAAFMLILLSGSDPSAEDIILKAHSYAESGRYSLAVKEYGKLVEDEDFQADAYLGIAEALVFKGDEEGAILNLETGYSITEDKRLEDMLHQLREKIKEDVIDEAADDTDEAAEDTAGDASD